MVLSKSPRREINSYFSLILQPTLLHLKLSSYPNQDQAQPYKYGKIPG